MSQLGNQPCHLIPQPGMSRIVIAGPMPQQRYRDLPKLHRERATGEPEFGREQPSQSRLHGDDDAQPECAPTALQPDEPAAT